MKTGGRYHQTREGGSFHTDSPQWTRVPDFIGLCCINPAKKGGESKFVSAYKIHNEMLKTHQDYLSILYEKFHFDKRGEFVDGESPTVFEPIFKFEKNFLKCRYLRNYINDGHKIQKLPLNNKQVEALDYFDEIIHAETNAAEYNLLKKDIVFFNNNRIIHGRTSFEDFDDTINPASSLEIQNFIYRGLNYFYLYKADTPELANDAFVSNDDKNNFLDNYQTPEALFDYLKSDQDRFSNTEASISYSTNNNMDPFEEKMERLQKK